MPNATGNVKIITVAIGLLFACGLAVDISAETIRGKACYRFSDNESIQAERDIALSMAKGRRWRAILFLLMPPPPLKTLLSKMI